MIKSASKIDRNNLSVALLYMMSHLLSGGFVQPCLSFPFIYSCLCKVSKSHQLDSHQQTQL